MAAASLAGAVQGLILRTDPCALGALDRSRCVVVSHVSPNGPAAAAGLRRGDHISAVDGQSAVSVLGVAGYDQAPLTRGEHVYRCHREDGSWSFTTTDGFPLGVAVEPTVEAADQLLANSVHPDTSLLFQLWLAGEWSLLLFHSSQITQYGCCGRLPRNSCAAKRCRRSCGLTSAVLPSLRLPSQLGHFVASSLAELDSPALLFQGAALLELGRSRGLRLIEWFYRYYEDDYTTDYQGVARLYLAHTLLSRSRQDDGGLLGAPTREREEGEALLEEAVELLAGEPRANHHMERLFAGSVPVPLLPPPAEPALPVLIFPDFGPFFDATAELPLPVGLEDVLSAVLPGQLHVIILLGPYRANGPYSELLREVGMLLRVLGPSGANLLTGCTVLTSAEDPPAASAQRFWMTRESQVQAEGHKLQVLRAQDDEQYTKMEGVLEEQLRKEICTSPVAGLLEADGRCHWLDKDLGHAAEFSIAVWNVAATVLAVRAERTDRPAEPEGEPEEGPSP